MPKAERAPMGEPDALQIAKAWHNAAQANDVTEVVGTWESQTHGYRDAMTASAQELIDLGHVL